MNNAGCSFLESGINFDPDRVQDCCIVHHGRGTPLLADRYNGEMIDWNALFEKKEARIKAQKEKTIPECEGCYRLSAYQFGNERKISDFHFSQFRICNAKCIYCSKEFNAGKRNYNPYPVIKDLIDKGYYKPGGEATFQGGEPLLMPDFEKLTALLCESGTTIRVHSSGIIFSESVFQILSRNKGTIVISLDAGSAKTYKKIKQTDTFKKVVANIKKYASTGFDNIYIKYVIVPGYNDNVFEASKFLCLMKELGIKTIALDTEAEYTQKCNNCTVSPHIYLLVDYFKYFAKKYEIRIIDYSFLQYALGMRNFYARYNPENKVLYAFKVWKLTDKKNYPNYGNKKGDD